MTLRILTRAWVLILIAAGLVLLTATQSPLIAHVDGWLYDLGQHLIRAPHKPFDRFAIIHLDEKGVAETGGKDMQRHALVALLQRIEKSDASAIGILMPLATAQNQAGITSIERIKGQLSSLHLSTTASQTLSDILDQELKLLDADSQLITTLTKFDQVVLPWQQHPPTDNRHALFINGQAGSSELPQLPLPELQLIMPFGPSLNLGSPLKIFAENSHLGWLGYAQNGSVQLLHRFDQLYAPSFALRLAAVAAGDGNAIELTPGGIGLGLQKIQTGPDLKGYLHPYPQDALASLTHLKLSSVLDASFNLKSLTDKIILIIDDSLIQQEASTGSSKLSSPTEQIVLSVANLLNGDLNTRPQGIQLSEMIIFVASLALLLLATRLRFAFVLAVMSVALLSLVAMTEYLLLTRQIWLQSSLALSLLLTGTVFIGLRRLYSHQNNRHQLTIADAHRQLGLTLQEQGKIELAFESFQKLPADNSSLELIYNLALDFERKRRYERAVSAYDHILRLKPGFKDVSIRRKKAEQMAHSLLTNSSQSTSAFLLMPDADGEKPQLGRYEVEKEIGRGAMGAVYLGRDPKIDRVVAIKTLALAQEFEETELKEVEERFFHEAAAAGRLNHPNIVTIYDAGEEHDLAYIAMEFLEGRPLSSFAAKNRLLPVNTVLEIIAQVADALDYASKQGVIHRDIKPANIMFDDKANVIKIADFGIARITSSSHTRTGVILGTPSYMSPEQITCQKIDGRSDIFSLGATMFTLLTGQKAFGADSIAALSHQITTDKHPDPLKIRPELPACVKAVIDKALQKEADKRYQSGTAMKRAIHRCLKSIS